MTECSCKAPVLWCDDIEYLTVNIMNEIDLNNDGINLYDVIETQIDQDHA
jgi:hypothetical protein